MRAHDVQELWLALPLSEERTIAGFVNEFRDDLVNVRFVPDMRSVALFESGMIDLIGTPAINLVASPALVKKEIFDRAFAAVALLALAPLFVVIAIAVKLSLRGPMFFTKKRKGADGRIFRIYSFDARACFRGRHVATNHARRSPRDACRRVSASHESRRAAEVLQRAARRYVGGRSASACHRA